MQSDWALDARRKGVQSESEKQALLKEKENLNKRETEAYKKFQETNKWWDKFYNEKVDPMMRADPHMSLNKVLDKFPDEKKRWDERNSTSSQASEFMGKRNEINSKLRELEQRPPDHPLLKNWKEMSLKRALKEAVDSGSDYLSWTTGDQQKARYNLSKQVNNIEWLPSSGGKHTVISIRPKNGSSIDLTVNKKDGTVFTSDEKSWEGKNLADVIGKGIGEKILSDKDGKGKLEGEGLNVGGEWANNLYDREVGNTLKKLTGQEVEKLDLGLPKDNKEKEDFVWDDGERLSPDTLNNKYNIGTLIRTSEIHNVAGSNFNEFHFTKHLGEGKFKVIPGVDFQLEYGNVVKKHPNMSHAEVVNEISKHPNNLTFDLNPKSESETQQAIRLSPQVKAMVQGKQIPLKQPSGKPPIHAAFQALKSRSQYPPEAIEKAKKQRGLV